MAGTPRYTRSRIFVPGRWIDVQCLCFVSWGRTFFMFTFNLSVVIRHLVGSQLRLPYFCHYCECDCIGVCRKKKLRITWWNLVQTQLMLFFLVNFLEQSTILLESWRATRSVPEELKKKISYEYWEKKRKKFQNRNFLLYCFFEVVHPYAIWCNFSTGWGDVSSKLLRCVLFSSFSWLIDNHN